MSNLVIWMQVYERQLKAAISSHPEEYAYSEDSLPLVLGRMQEAFARGSFLKDSRAIKATAKELGIPYTYKGIAAFISNVGNK